MLHLNEYKNDDYHNLCVVDCNIFAWYWRINGKLSMTTKGER
jgi:hypothetical protein